MSAFKDLNQYELNKLAFLRSVIKTMDELEDEMSEVDNSDDYLKAHTQKLKGFFKYFELNEDYIAKEQL